MGQEVRDDSRVCRTPPSPRNDLTWHLKPRTRIVAVSLTFILATAGLVWILTPPLPIVIPRPPSPPPPIGVITIDGDANFSATALLEGWPGNGTLGNTFIIDELDISFSDGANHCIIIRNTQVSFIISNCNFRGFDSGVGIYLVNVTNGEVVNNNCNNNKVGIFLDRSDHNTVENNTCSNKRCGISIGESHSNTVANNTCNDNHKGIELHHSHSNTVVNNTCNDNHRGIGLGTSHSNTITNNTCSRNTDYGISLIHGSESNIVTNNTCKNNDIGVKLLYAPSYNTVATNICNANRIGIYLSYGCLASNIIADNTFLGNTEHDLFEELPPPDEEFDPVILLPIGLVGIILLFAAWRILSGIRKVD